MYIQLIRTSKTPLFLQIKNALKHDIQDGVLINGCKLPSERCLSNELNVHRNTVVKAYRELVDEGLLEVRTKPRGYYVAYGRETLLPKSSLYTMVTPFEYKIREEYRQMNILFNRLYNQSFNEKIISFAADTASERIYPKKELDNIINELVNNRSDIDLYGYCSPQGLYELRTSIAKLLLSRNILINPTEIQIVAETYQALDYLLKLLVSSGNTIIVEEPISADYFNACYLHGANVITVPVDENGMRVDYLETLIIKYNPKFIFTMPTIHNPTGSVMSMDRRYKLLELSYKYDIPIVEEDCDSILQFEGKKLPSLKSMDKKNNVIYIDSFIFSVCPGLRIAYVVAPKKIVKKISQLLEMNQIFVNTIGQHVIKEFIDIGYYDNHLKEMREYFMHKRDVMCNELDSIEEFKVKYEIPQGGTNIWCRLPDVVNQNKLLVLTHKMGVIFAPGHVFFPYGNLGESFIRLSYGCCSDEEIIHGINILKKAILQSS